MRTRTIMLLALLAPALAACASGRPAELGSEGPTVLEVDNQSNLDVTVYVLRTGANRERLGLTVAHTTSRFTIPPRLMVGGLTALRFQADPIGATAEPITREIVVEPGDTVILVIPPGSADGAGAARASALPR